MMFKNLMESLIKANIKLYGLEDLGLICLYDDDNYSNIDYDFVSNQHRSFLRSILLNNGWKSKSSRLFIKDNFEVLFPKPTAVLGTDPSDAVSKEMKKDRYIFCTSSQAFLIMAKKGKWDHQRACEIVKNCPANIDKVYQWMNEYKLTSPSKEQLTEIKKIQTEGFKKKVLARKRSGL